MKKEKTSFRNRVIVILAYISIVIFVSSCATKKTLVEKTEKKEETQIVLPSKTEIVVTNICDSINLVPGKEKKVDYVFEKGPVSGKLQINGDIVSLIIKTDSIINTNKESDVFKEKETIKYKNDFKLLFFVAAIGFLIGYSKPWKMFLK